jgi:phosphatidylethanolamine-binding protein (PEBP) family uncharacterized protein
VTRTLALCALLAAACSDDGGALDAATTTVDAGPGADGGSFQLTSTAFAADGTLPIDYTCDGVGVSPPFAWSGTPAGTVELALIMSTEALDGTRWNWVLYHIPGGTTSLAEADPVGTCGLTSDGPDLAYYPPCSQGPGLKTYTFTLHALSAVPTFSVPAEQVTATVLQAAIVDHTLGTAQIAVGYARPTDAGP